MVSSACCRLVVQVFGANIGGSQVPGQHDKEGKGVVAMVKYLPDTCEALGSIPSRKLMKTGRIEMRKMEMGRMEMRKIWVGGWSWKPGEWRMDREMMRMGKMDMEIRRVEI